MPTHSPTLVVAVVLTCAAARSQQFQFMSEQTRAPSFSPPAGAGPRSDTPVAGDFDGDGRGDVVFLTSTGFEFQRNLGGGRYAGSLSPLPFSVQSSAMDLRGADMDNDGDLDIVLTTLLTVEVHPNNGSGSFGAATVLLLPGSQTPLFSSRAHHGWDLGDVDGDGDVDLVRADQNTIRKVENLGGTFAAPVVVLTVLGSIEPIELALADLDGDLDLDLATTAPRPAGGSELLQNDGLGNFAAAAGFSASFGPLLEAIVAADFDGDGDLDLMVGGQITSIALHSNQGGGAFVDSSGGLPAGSLSAVLELHAADFDRDGDVDVLAPGLVPGLLDNRGGNQFLNVLSSRMPLGNTLMLNATVLDSDDDGDPDVATAQARGGAIGAGLLTNHVRQLVGATQPRVGGSFELDIYSGPGFAPPGITMTFASLALPAAPLALPGLEGKLDLDLAVSGFAALRVMSSVGATRLSIPIAGNPALAGTAIVFQHARLPQSLPPGLGNAVLETVTL